MKMKKIFAIVLVVALVFALGACSKKTDDGGSSPNVSGSPDTGSKIDIKGSGRQTVSDERATEEQLQAALDWQESHADKFSLTYEDYVAQIGVEASEYEWSGSTYGTYFWFASDDSNVSLHPSFTGGTGKLLAGGSSGLSF